MALAVEVVFLSEVAEEPESAGFELLPESPDELDEPFEPDEPPSDELPSDELPSDEDPFDEAAGTVLESLRLSVR